MSDGTELEPVPATSSRSHLDDAWVVGDEPWVSVDFEAMRTSGSSGRPGRTDPASIVFTDIVDSTARRQSWPRVARPRRRHNRKASTAIDRHQTTRQTTGDGVLAQFDGAERAVRGAAAIRDAAEGLGLAIRAGVHTGEVQAISDDVRGIAVHTAARIMAVAGSGEILVSATVMDLLDGSGLSFEDAGIYELKGLHGSRQLYRLAPLERTETRVAGIHATQRSAGGAGRTESAAGPQLRGCNAPVRPPSISSFSPTVHTRLHRVRHDPRGPPG
jgi:class 3 adenylate cyclase